MIPSLFSAQTGFVISIPAFYIDDCIIYLFCSDETLHVRERVGVQRGRALQPRLRGGRQGPGRLRAHRRRHQGDNYIVIKQLPDKNVLDKG